MSVRISLCVAPIYRPTHPHPQNKMIGQIIDALRVAAFSWVGGISVHLVCSLIFARRVTGRNIIDCVCICDP